MKAPNKLKELRQQKGLTLKEAAIPLGISEAALCLYENGKREPKIAMMKKLSAFYKRSPQYIFFSD